jgi:predicted metal-dependent hydrolase
LSALTPTNWPPPYTIRISKKAKRVNLRVLHNVGLEIVIPARQQKYVVIAEVLEEFKDWILKHTATVIVRPKQHITTLNLRALNEIWHIQYQKTFSTNIRHSICKGSSTHTLTLYGAVDDIERTHLWLQKWLKKRASQMLIPWLEQLSQQHNLPFTKVSVRGQQTLWGSCTPNHDISLNFKLLFLLPQHATHVMLHELCHTKHLNHSKRFWQLLLKLDPNCMEHDRAIKHGDKLVDIWLN